MDAVSVARSIAMKHSCLRLMVMALVAGAGMWGTSPSTGAEEDPSGSPDVALVWQGAQYLCSPEEEDAGEEVHATVQATSDPHSGVGCTILRPVGWHRFGFSCLEGPTTPVFVENGQKYTAYAVPFGFLGSGYTTLLCNGGALTTTAKVCKPGSTEP
jgi:hypothetical protein